MSDTGKEQESTLCGRPEEALRWALLDSLFANLLRSMAALLIVGLVLAGALWPHFDHARLLGWWALLALVVSGRLGFRLWWQHSRHQHSPRFWSWGFRIGAMLTALVWSVLVPWFMWDATQAYQMFIAFMTAGIVAGAVPSLAADLRLLLVYVVALLAPVAITLILQAGGLGVAMGAGILIFLIMMGSISLEYHRTLSEAIRGQHALAVKERETRQLFEHVPTGVFYYDTDLRLRDCNTAFADTVQAGRQQLLGVDMRRLRDQRILPTLLEPIEQGKEAHYQGEYISHFSGIETWGDIHVAPIFDEDGRVRGAIGAIQDRTREHWATVELERLALYDSLTGLPNRKLFQERVRQALKQLRRSDRMATLLYLDLDDFKRINDSHGHAAGDRLLVEFSRRLQGALRAEDTLGRLGGDEFVVLAFDLSSKNEQAIHHGLRVAEKIHSLCIDPFDLGDRQVYTAASIGLVVVEPDLTLEELLRRADTAMYRAKAAGKGQTAFYDEAMDRSAREYARLVERLRAAVAEGGFELRFQPIIGLTDGRVAGAEVLLRWEDAELGPVPPDRFIPVAEESTLIEGVGRWVLERVCRQWAEWQGQGMDLPDYLSINVSPRELRNRDYPDQLGTLLQQHGVEPSRIRLEITESVLAEDMETVMAVLKRIEDLGVGCMLDDFGTGYSSLSYLKRLPVSTIKVDREFVRDLQSDPDDAALIRAVVDIAEQFGCQVVAEGVETEAQRDVLLGMSPQILAQGYLFSAPLPAREFVDHVLRRNSGSGSAAGVD